MLDINNATHVILLVLLAVVPLQHSAYPAILLPSECYQGAPAYAQMAIMPLQHQWSYAAFANIAV